MNYDGKMKNSVQGAQVVGRAAALLRIIGRSSGDGAALPAIVEAAGLTRPTVYRLVHSLASEGLLDYHESTRTWHLGPEIYVLGAIAANRYAIEDVAQPSLQRLADQTGESAFLSTRRGDETVCLLRMEGSFPVRSFVLHEGVRFPLGVASAGLAIMAFLPDEEVDRLLDNERRRRAAIRARPQHGENPSPTGSNPPHRIHRQPGTDPGGQLGDGRGGLRPQHPPGLGTVPDRNRTTLPPRPAAVPRQTPARRSPQNHPTTPPKRIAKVPFLMAGMAGLAVQDASGVDGDEFADVFAADAGIEQLSQDALVGVDGEGIVLLAEVRSR